MLKLILFITIFCINASLLSFADSTKHFSVMTFNIENGGTRVDFNKIVEAIQKSDADIVGIQEAWGNTHRLAKALGWKYYDPRQHIVSRFPLFETNNSQGMYVFVEIEKNKFVVMSNVHLPSEPYGPTLIHEGSTKAAIIQNERKVRLPTAIFFMNKLTLLAKQGIPVFLTGDFNSPSHLDWTAASVNILRNHRYALAWPVTKIAEGKGFIDSYRKMHPDPIKNPGYTWSAKRPFVKDSSDDFNPSSKDLPDRIDFILTTGPSQVVNSQIIGEQSRERKISVAPWPSDHRAVISKFKVDPFPYPIKNLIHVSDRLKWNGQPNIIVSKKIVCPNESIKIKWINAPGNRYDYSNIYNQKTPEHREYLYTHGKINGSTIYSTKNIPKNWLDWYKGETLIWPLTSGIYNIQLMLDDGPTVLSSTTITVLKF